MGVANDLGAPPNTAARVLNTNLRKFTCNIEFKLIAPTGGNRKVQIHVYCQWSTNLTLTGPREQEVRLLWPLFHPLSTHRRTDWELLFNQATLCYTMISSNTGVIQLDMFEPETDSEEHFEWKPFHLSSLFFIHTSSH